MPLAAIMAIAFIVREINPFRGFNG